MTTSVTLIEWASGFEPVPDVPVTVKVYVPAGVPVTIVVPLTNPEHPAPCTTINIANASDRRICRRLPTTMVASRARIAISHGIFVGSLCLRRAGKIHRGPAPGPTIPWAVVVTVMVVVEALDPFRVTVLGEIVQVPAWGAPLQLRFTA